MECIFLGTSSGTPTRSRNVSALALRGENAKQWQLIDCGEGTQHRLLRTGLSLLTLETIFITHIHGDHCFGLPGLLGSASMAGRTNPLLIVCPQSVRDYIESTITITQMFLSFELQFGLVEETAALETEQFTVTILPLSHRVPSYAFKFTEKGLLPKLDTEKLKADNIPAGPLWGCIQRGELIKIDEREIKPDQYQMPARKARAVLIAGDNDTPSILGDAALKVDLLIHESTYTEEMRIKMGDAPQHSSAKKVAQFAQEAGVKNLILTHFSPRYQDFTTDSPCLNDIRTEAVEHYEGRLFLAKDLECYRLTRVGIVERSD